MLLNWLQLLFKRASVALCVCVLLALFGGCSKPKPLELSIAISPWPGYELLYLATEQGYFDELGLNVRLVELNSLSDAQRAYMSGQVDGLTSTLVEAVLIQVDSAYPLQVVLPTDYSFGGDMILAQAGIAQLKDLKGKRVGCETNSLGILFLHRALQTVGLTLEDVHLVSVAQQQGSEALALGVLDAMVTYPPAALAGLEVDGVHTLFSSRAVPEEILDVLSIKQSVIERHPELILQILAAWQRAYEFTKEHPEQAFALMAEREQVSVEQFAHIYNHEIQILSRDDALTMLRDWSSLTNKLMETCEVLKAINQHGHSCSRVHSMVNRGAY